MKGVGRVVAVALPVVAILLVWSVAVAQTHHGNHGTQAAQAKGAVCEVCSKPLVASSEVTLRSADEKQDHHYRCIHCALVAARDRFKSDVTLRAKSISGGAPVQWTRTGGTWSVTPASAEVLARPEKSGDCLQDHLVFSDDGEAKAYLKSHPSVASSGLLPAGKVDSILSAGRPPLPKTATCPVSGEAVHPTAKTDWTVYDGKVYYFCCAGCKPKFVANAEGYLSGTAPKPKNAESCGGHESGGGCGHCGGQKESPSTGGHAHGKAAGT